MIFNMVGGGAAAPAPETDTVPVLGTDFTYTGNCEVIDDSDAVLGTQWRIKFLTSGTLTTSKEWLVDLFLVGGGGRGSNGEGSYSVSRGGGGGDGGQINLTESLPVAAQIGLPIVIGGTGGDTTALGQTATAGGGGSLPSSTSMYRGGDGGDGHGTSGAAANGSIGGAGGDGAYEFFTVGSDMYGGGGGGGAGNSGGGGGGTGGAGGGGNGGSISAGAGSAGTANTGGGGGGGGGGGIGGAGGAGGSGIVIMRKHKESAT